MFELAKNRCSSKIVYNNKPVLPHLKVRVLHWQHGTFELTRSYFFFSYGLFVSLKHFYSSIDPTKYLLLMTVFAQITQLVCRSLLHAVECFWPAIFFSTLLLSEKPLCILFTLLTKQYHKSLKGKMWGNIHKKFTTMGRSQTLLPICHGKTPLRHNTESEVIINYQS